MTNLGGVISTNSKRRLWALIAIAVLIVIVGVVFLRMNWSPRELPGPVVPIVPVGWKMSAENDLKFAYPESLGTSYISLTDWPPKAQVLDQVFSCTEGGSEIERAGETKRQIIGGRTYCVTKASEGAAGSIYTMYAYAFALADPSLQVSNNGLSKTVILTFSLRFVQCGNYDEPQKTACDEERSAFEVGSTIDKIVQTITFDK